MYMIPSFRQRLSKDWSEGFGALHRFADALSMGIVDDIVLKKNKYFFVHMIYAVHPERLMHSSTVQAILCASIISKIS